MGLDSSSELWSSRATFSNESSDTEVARLGLNRLDAQFSMKSHVMKALATIYC
jgi:hypothetical protein